jgi:hypothetical protein
MNSTLPSRWQEILRREAAENVGTVLAQARQQPDRRRLPRWTVPALVVGGASVFLFSVLGGNASPEKGTVPFDRSTVISTSTAGLGASVEDLAPRAPAATPAVAPQMPLAPAAPEPRSPTRPVRAAGHTQAACPECEKRRAAMLALEATPLPAATPVPAPTLAAPPKEPPLTVNLGTRVEAVLTDPIVTGAAFAPATAKLTTDLHVGDRLAIPAQTVLVGEGFATEQDDRAQVLFTAIVRDGRTIKFEGWALQQGEMGIPARVIRKGSKTKKGAGTVLGAAASALTYGLAGSAGPEGAALASLGQTAANDLGALGRDWRRSNKVVRVEAGAPITIYIRRDLTIE